jgi:Flp pilus assembly protein TadG
MRPIRWSSRSCVRDVRFFTHVSTDRGCRLVRGLRWVWRNESGQSTLIITFLFGVLLFAFLAVGIDAGYIFQVHRRAQAAADAAAVAAAEAKISGNSDYMQTAAETIAAMNGMDHAALINPAKITVNLKPTSGNYAGNSSYVEVIVTKPTQTSFLGFLNPAGSLMSVSARAVAGGGSTAPTCICLMNSTGNDLGLSNNAQINAPTCGVVDDSASSNAVTITGSAGLNALSLGTVSTTWNNSSNINNSGYISSTTKVVQGIAACSTTVSAPVLPSGITCYDNPINGWTERNGYSGKFTLPYDTETTTNSVLCLNSLDTSQSSSVTFSPGITYYIKGSFTTGGGAPLTGSNVSFYVGGNISIANGVTVNLTAPYESDGVTPGTLFYANGTSVSIQGGSTSTLRGLLYAPNADVNLANGTSTTLTMDVYAKTLTMAGGATLNSYADKNLGSLSIGGSQLVE